MKNKSMCIIDSTRYSDRDAKKYNVFFFSDKGIKRNNIMNFDITILI